FRGRNNSDEIALYDDLRIREFGFVELASGNQSRAKRSRMNDSSVQHAGQANIGGPGFFRADFGNDDGIGKGLANDRVLADGRHRRIAFDSQTENAGKISTHGNREF